MTTAAAKLLLGGVRNFVKKTGGSGGKKFGLVTYYPRKRKHVDPPVTPTKLLMVQRIKPVKGNPWWHKDLLAGLGLDGKSSAKAIVKNTPEVAASLWTIKHLIKVTPIATPNGLPKDGDFTGTYLHENGTFMVTPKVAIDDGRIKAIESHKTDWKQMDGETLRRDSRMKWLNPLA